jgi:hypothetical protein
MIAPPMLATLKSGSGARSLRGFNDLMSDPSSRMSARSEWRNSRSLALTRNTVTSSSERFSGYRSPISVSSVSISRCRSSCVSSERKT